MKRATLLCHRDHAGHAVTGRHLHCASFAAQPHSERVRATAHQTTDATSDAATPSPKPKSLSNAICFREGMPTTRRNASTSAVATCLARSASFSAINLLSCAKLSWLKASARSALFLSAMSFSSSTAASAECKLARASSIWARRSSMLLLKEMPNPGNSGPNFTETLLPRV